MDLQDLKEQYYNILIIEDDEEDVLLLREIIAQMQDIQYELLHKPNLTEGLKILKQKKFDVILLDLGLPECSGFETVKRIIADNPSSAIVVMTGLNDNECATKALEMGMDDYLVKGSIDPQILSRAIRYAVQRKMISLDLKEKENYYRSLISKLHEDIIVIDRDFTITDINNSFMQTVGDTRGNVIGKKCFEITHREKHPCSNKENPCYLQKVFETGEYAKCVHKHKNIDGTDRFVDIILSPLKDEDGKVIRVIEAARDITEFIELNNQLEKSLREKEILLAEVHHRVKNNMQIISSLLKMEASSVKNQEAFGCLQDSRNRVKSMSLIHERLYKSNDFTHIEIDEYVKHLAAYFFRMYVIDPQRIKLKTDIHGIDLSINSAIPLGLIINELLSNSLKYAFPNEREGFIEIDLTELATNKYILVYKDDGIGLPVDFEMKNTYSLGLQLVNNLTEQIHGTLDVLNENGAKFEIEFSEVFK